VPIVEKQDVVEHLAPGATDEALCHRVHVRRPDRGLDDPCASAFRHVVEGRPELVVAIAQQDCRTFAVDRGMAQLLFRLRLGRVPGGRDMDHAPRRQVDDAEGVDLPETGGRRSG
jgi:hypothetical protein